MKIKLVIIALLTLFASLACAFDDDLNPFNFSFNFSGGTCQEQRPILAFSPMSSAFGNVSTGTTISRLFTVTNTGRGLLSGIQPRMSSATGGFRVYSSSGTTAPSTFKVAFAPVAAGAAANVVYIDSDQLDSGRVPVSGTGTAADPYTDVFTSYFDGSDVIDTGGIGLGVPWTTETDTASLLALNSGSLQYNLAGGTTVGYLTKDLVTARSDIRVEWTINLSTQAGWRNSGASATTQMIVLRNSANGTVAAVGAGGFGAGTAYTGWAFSGTTAGSHAMSAGPHDMALMCQAVAGICQLTMDGVEILTKTGLTIADFRYVRVGLIYQENMLTASGLTIDYDNIVVGYK